MHRFYLPPAECQGPTLCLRGSEAHHAIHVLRLRAQDRVTLLDGQGHQLHCQIREVRRDRLQLDVLQKQAAPPLPHRITLIQAIPKGKLIDDIIQKATELGAFRVLPLVTERVVSHIAPSQAADKACKWRQIAVESIKQCGTPWLPVVEPPSTLHSLLARHEPFDLSLVACFHPENRHPRAWLAAYRDQHRRMPHTLAVWIGPEGDFTPEELAQIRGAGALPITLGPLVLRSATAAIYTLSILNYELSWSAPAHGKLVPNALDASASGTGEPGPLTNQPTA